jgi:hypothetical protein
MKMHTHTQDESLAQHPNSEEVQCQQHQAQSAGEHDKLTNISLSCDHKSRSNLD